LISQEARFGALFARFDRRPFRCGRDPKSAIERLISPKARLGALLTRFRENRLGEGGKTNADEKPDVFVV
jgi:hypothetical protein